MFRRLSGISIMCQDMGKVWNTYRDVLGLKAGPNKQVFEKGRYIQHTYRIGEAALWLLEPLDPPDAPGPGGGMARFIQRRGEGMYMITVGLGDEGDRYAKRLEAKGVKVYWDIPDSGEEVGGGPKRGGFQMNIHPLVHPRSAHGVLWEMGRYIPGPPRQHAPANNPFKRVVSINIVVKDADEAIKTYTEVFELDSLIGSTVYEKSGYKASILGMGDTALEFRQPLHGPDDKTPGGAMARALREYGEGLYSATVDVKDAKAYHKGLQSRGGKAERVAVESGKLVAGRPNRQAPQGASYFIIDPRSAHGVIWEVATFGPMPVEM